MELKIRELLPKERNYTYTQSQQIIMQTGCIGHLRGDMDSDGNGFFTSWDNHVSERNNSEFKDEFKNIVDALRFDERFGNILKNRKSLAAYCHAHPDSGFKGNFSREFGFRADTENYSYMIRCNPNKGEYNFYIYAYQRKWLDKHLNNAEKGIRFIDPDYNEKFLIPDGDQIRIAFPEGGNVDKVCRYIDECHLEVGSNLYHICEFAEYMERAGNKVIPLRASLPDQCYSILADTGELIILKKGESGYFKTDMNLADKAKNTEIVDELNGKLGISKAQAEAMSIGSMFGWSAPGADPNNWNIDGKPIAEKNLNEINEINEIEEEGEEEQEQ